MKSRGFTVKFFEGVMMALGVLLALGILGKTGVIGFSDPTTTKALLMEAIDERLLGLDNVNCR